jgi:hypothetical protein
MSDRPTQANDELTATTYTAEHVASDAPTLPASIKRVRVHDEAPDGYHHVQYLDADGNEIAARDIAAYKLDNYIQDGNYRVATNAKTEPTGSVRRRQAAETAACLSLAVKNQDATQLKMAYHSARATITG